MEICCSFEFIHGVFLTKKEAIYKAADAVHEKGSKVKIEVVARDAVGLESKWSGHVQMK